MSFFSPFMSSGVLSLTILIHFNEKITTVMQMCYIINDKRYINLSALRSIHIEVTVHEIGCWYMYFESKSRQNSNLAGRSNTLCLPQTNNQGIKLSVWTHVIIRTATSSCVRYLNLLLWYINFGGCEQMLEAIWRTERHFLFTNTHTCARCNWNMRYTQTNWTTQISILTCSYQAATVDS